MWVLAFAIHIGHIRLVIVNHIFLHGQWQLNFKKTNLNFLLKSSWSWMLTIFMSLRADVDRELGNFFSLKLRSSDDRGRDGCKGFNVVLVDFSSFSKFLSTKVENASSNEIQSLSFTLASSERDLSNIRSISLFFTSDNISFASINLTRTSLI